MSEFSNDFRQDFGRLLRWRRDVRHFLPDAVDGALLQRSLNSFALAPSVGLSQPWRLVRLQSVQARARALANFKLANADALAGYSGEKSRLYASLKLSGMSDSPEQIAVFCDNATIQGGGLGTATMPEMRRYSVVAAITQFWLVARASGLGVGWVSILDPGQLRRDLDVPETWALVAYLCIGWPKDVTDMPELERVGWETRTPEVSLLER